MRSATLDKPFLIRQEEMAIPIPGEGEVRIRIKEVGICGSDIHFFLGHRLLDKPMVIGHEGLGIIDQVGLAVDGLRVGDRVVIEPNIPCFSCKYCLKGKSMVCPNKRVIGLTEPGCFAEYVCMPSDFVHLIPTEISDEDAVVIEPMAVAYHALKSSNAKPGETIAVIGLGAIGLLITHLAIALGYKVCVLETQAQKNEIAQKMGATPVPSLQVEDIERYWLENEIVAIFECAGASQTASFATSCAPRGSEIILVGLSEQLATFQPLKLVREGISIIPSLIYKHPTDFKDVIELIQHKVIQPGQIISGYYPLDQLQEAFMLASKGSEAKLIIQISEI